MFNNNIYNPLFPNGTVTQQNNNTSTYANPNQGYVQQQYVQPQQAYVQQPQQVIQQVQQPMAQQPVNGMSVISFNGIIVDPNWNSPELYELEKPDFLIQNSGIQGHRLPDNNDMYKTTTSLLNRVRIDLDNDGRQSIRFTTDPDPSTGRIWALDFKMALNDSLRCRTVYIDRCDNLNTGVANPLIKSIDSLIANERAVKDYSTATANYSSVFASITSKTNLRAQDAARLYISLINSAMNIVSNTITNSRYITKDSYGRYIMSYTLYDILTSGNITIGGISLRPMLKVNNMGQLEVGATFDFDESISVKYKGDFDHRESSISRIKY